MTHRDRHSDFQLASDPQKSWWSRQSIRLKTTILAIAIGTIPTVAIGTIAYYFAADSITKQSTELRQNLVVDLQNQIGIFMSDRLKDIEMMARLSIFSNPELRATATAEEKAKALQQIQDIYKIYDSIAVFDVRGNFIAKTDGKSSGNHLNRSYLQAAIAADDAIISEPLISSSSGVYSIYTAAPIKDGTSGATIGYVRARMPVSVLKNLLQTYQNDSNRYYILDRQNRIFLSSAGEYSVRTLSDLSFKQTDSGRAKEFSQVFSGIDDLLTDSQLTAGTAFNTQTQTEQFLAIAPNETLAGLPQLGWRAVIAAEREIVFAPQRRLRWIFTLGTGLVALGVGAVAYIWAKRLLHPILQAASAVQNIGRGDFNVKVPVTGADEIARLGTDINRMAEQLSEFVETQTLLVRQSESLKSAIFQLTTVKKPLDILEIAVNECNHTLNANRTLYYRFSSEAGGTVIAECVARGHGSVLHENVLSPEQVNRYRARSSQGDNRVQTFTNSLIEQLDLHQVNGLIVPVTIEDEPDGILITERDISFGSWREEEAEFMSQMAAQISLAAARLNSLEQQQQAEIREKTAREALQSRALSLIQEVCDVSAGDLTIRANVSEDEIGTIADSYNSIIESLQKLVERTKTAAAEVKLNTSDNDLAVQSLTQAAVTQATEIARMLERLQNMEQSLDLVATQATAAEEYVQQTNQTIDGSDETMNRTVAEISAVQHTVKQTATKAAKLGESSREISQAVNAIGGFAAQTHLLALKASIEAARAGEQGKGFAVIAGEVRSLATQSAEATAAIETLVSRIQLETGELVEVMNLGTAQIESGSQLVRQTQQSLTQIGRASNEISKLVDSINQTARQQSSISTEVTETMVRVAEIARENSQSATKVSHSIGQLSAIADRLQSNIDRFKT